ncbi:winged helix-turn-helix domain-containing protein [Arthrobacter sp. M4]|uniref:winged helix-turn-helix domain-containing protein n=1 Tax=Arthrobacter sp. M4 TaxID=218160 RepID=UPI001CDCE679|nr:winged helix-turn-helix domain-containing protein [Arthrobacter sp. M4]MCA4134744.1 winged helix-turn-helix domain-containing protein [Arthrobacter sp. M4]
MAVNAHFPRRAARAQACGLAVWVQPAEGQEIDAETMARAAELVLRRAQLLAPGAQASIWPASGTQTSGVGDAPRGGTPLGSASSGGTPLQAADAGNPPAAVGTPDGGTPPEAPAAPASLASRRSQVAVDLAADVVLLDGEPVPFTAMEYKLLRYLVENCSRAISREELQRLIESLDCPGAAFRSIDVYVGRVRRKLGPARHAVATVRGGGYQFVPGPNASVRGPAEYSI